MKTLITAALAAATFTSTADAASQHHLTCNVNGEASQMYVEVEVINRAGIVQNFNGDITDVIGLGEVLIYTQGYIRNSQGQLNFNGENQYADFWNPNGGGRFRVEWIVDRPHLIAVVDPLGARTPIYCREN